MMEAPNIPLPEEALRKLGSNRGVKYDAMQKFQYENMFGQVPLQFTPWRDASGAFRAIINDDNVPVVKEQLVEPKECDPVVEHVIKEIKKRKMPMVPHTSPHLAHVSRI
jgi:hypothetical protein